MVSQTCHLPNGQSFTVTPIFGGVNFKSNDWHTQHAPLPPGWTIVISTNRKPGDDKDDEEGVSDSDSDLKASRFTGPTLNRDSFYISAIVNPPSHDYKPVTSPTRQIAMMVWVTLLWYFHQPEPTLQLDTDASAKTPAGGKPKGDWRVHIKRDGVFKGRNLLQKLERMGLIASEESFVGYEPIETRESSAWMNMFVSRRSFWQIDPRLFLFNLTPAHAQSMSSNPPSGRNSPSRGDNFRLVEGAGPSVGEGTFSTATGGPFISSSHLPTYYPPPPTQFTFTNGVRHPIRPKPPHQGEVFYVRYIPSVGQYLSFRVPFLPSSKSNNHPSSATHSYTHNLSINSIEQQFQNMPSDLDIVHKWMNDPRVNASWGEAGPPEHQEEFLRMNLRSKHSFPVIGCWDGKPFGYFEIYWVKEDKLGQLLGGTDNYDRGIHLLVGEQEYRGPHRVAIWLSALVHFCWLADFRTQTVMLEPRVDNQKYVPPLSFLGSWMVRLTNIF